MNNLPLVLSVTSGKGGVGKTNLSVNLSCRLAAEGKRVVLLDADLGLANVDVLLGLTPTSTFSISSTKAQRCPIFSLIPPMASAFCPPLPA